ncbi:MAG: carbohydrate ABC transporter permease [Anaerolineae bacterium]|nr:carbohydrate ABC transporter permease [Anaerolineae bacterium]
MAAKAQKMVYQEPQITVFPKTRLSYAVRYLLLALVLAFFLFPLFWLGTLAFKTPDEYFASPPVWLPPQPTLIHLQTLLASKGISSLANSLIIAGGATLLAVTLGIPAAYSMARFNTGGQNLAMWILSQRMLPPVVIVLPIFIMFRSLRWVDTLHGMIVLYAAFNLPYVIWMMRGYFRDIPREIEDSALVDGCGYWGTLWRITVPLTMPGLLTTAAFTFIFAWNEFLFAVVLTRINATPITVAISGMFGAQSAFLGQVSWLSWIALAPIFVLTLVMQRYLVRGMTMGAVR